MLPSYEKLCPPYLRNITQCFRRSHGTPARPEPPRRSVPSLPEQGAGAGYWVAAHLATARLSEGARAPWGRVWCCRGCVCNSHHPTLKFRSRPPAELHALRTCHETVRWCRVSILHPSAQRRLLIRSVVTCVFCQHILDICSSYKHDWVKSFVHCYVGVSILKIKAIIFFL